jgi:hypothetical protein
LAAVGRCSRFIWQVWRGALVHGDACAHREKGVRGPWESRNGSGRDGTRIAHDRSMNREEDTGMRIRTHTRKEPYRTLVSGPKVVSRPQFNQIDH